MPDLVEDSPWLDIVPPSMAGVGRDGWLLRPVPYNGGGVLPDWVMHQPQRPRVAVILGTIVPRMRGVGVVERIVALAVVHHGGSGTMYAAWTPGCRNCCCPPALRTGTSTPLLSSTEALAWPALRNRSTPPYSSD